MMNRYLGTFCMATLILFCGLTGCRKEDYRLIFSHQLHVVDNEIECVVCHQTTDGGMTIPGHEICSGCHEIDEEHPSADCLMCHRAKAPSEIEARVYAPEAKAEKKEIIFSHKTPAHSKASCDTCHINVSQAMNTKELELPQLQTCLPCHNGETAPLEDCSLCHAGSSPINGTHKLTWITKHGIESKFGNSKCFVCHQQIMCIVCHRDQKPLDHNASWRIINHGAQAAWNRTRCMACHQEDFCERCHEQDEPRSHRGGWVSGPTRHCFVCHFPISSVPCSTCHKAAPHATAPASPHPPFVGFDCAECHPGGIPGRPPHPNPGILCTICHPRR